MAEPSEGVPPAAPELAELRAAGEQQLRDGMFLDAVKTLTTALDLAQGAGLADAGLELLHADAMQKAALVRAPRRAGQPSGTRFSIASHKFLTLLPLLQVGPAAFDAPASLVGKVQNFLADAGIGAGGGAATQRHFDYEPMLSFAMEEGLADETAEEIYRLWVERKMEGAIDSYDIVQSHLREVPLKVRVHVPGGSLSEAQPIRTALTAGAGAGQASRSRRLPGAALPRTATLRRGADNSVRCSESLEETRGRH